MNGMLVQKNLILGLVKNFTNELSFLLKRYSFNTIAHMISIIKKEDCCGCSACYTVCPKHCIQMLADREGFKYPQVNTFLCINCGLCEKVCPLLHPFPQRKPLKILAAVNKDSVIREKSSSGGLF